MFCFRESSNSTEFVKFCSLLLKRENVFSKHKRGLGSNQLVEHNIDTSDVYQLSNPLAFVEEAHKVLSDVPSTLCHSTLNFPPGFTFGPSPVHSSFDPCVDYRCLTAMIQNGAFPIPRMKDHLDAMADTTLFSTMDIASAYNLVPVGDHDILKTPFMTKYGLCNFIIFGLMTSPGTSHRLMELVFQVFDFHQYPVTPKVISVTARTMEMC